MGTSRATCAVLMSGFVSVWVVDSCLAPSGDVVVVFKPNVWSCACGIVSVNRLLSHTLQQCTLQCTCRQSGA